MDALNSSGRRLLSLATAILLVAPGLVGAQVATEPVVKAAFLFKFAGYVEWPAQYFPTPEAPIAIGVTSSDDVAASLESLAPGRNINGRAVAVKRLREGDVPQAMHIVFIGRAERNPRAAIRAAQQQGALAVTEVPNGLELGSAINFVPVDDRIGFEVSLESAEKSGLRISARMLGVARRVIPR